MGEDLACDTYLELAINTAISTVPSPALVHPPSLHVLPEAGFGGAPVKVIWPNT
jgi:hypothetical protein